MSELETYCYIAGSFLVGIVIGVLVCAYYSAPEGYEDESGFHLGKEDDDK